MYEDYYAQQVGGSQIPVFRGARYQRGHGIGSALGGLFRRIVLPFLENTNILPFLRKNKRLLLGQALKTGMEVADDVVEGKPLKESVKRRLLTGIKRTADGVDWQMGSGRRRGHSVDIAAVRKKRATKRRRKSGIAYRRDMFD